MVPEGRGAMTGSAKALALAVVVAGALAATPAFADHTVYRYRVDHHTYGDIGTYVNIVDRTGKDAKVETQLHVAVKLLGIVMFRQDATRIEHWHGDRLVSFHGVTVTNGHKLELTGRARGEDFVLTTPSGTVVAPGNVHPTNPWSPMVLHSDEMMSTSTGRLFHVAVTGGNETNVTLDGMTFRLRQFEIHSDKHEFVWLNDSGVTVAFRTVKDGTPIDFILTRQVAGR